MARLQAADVTAQGLQSTPPAANARTPGSGVDMRLVQARWLVTMLAVAAALTVYFWPSAPLHDALHEGMTRLASRAFPDVPAALAPDVPEGRVRVSLLPSPSHVAQVRALVDPKAVAFDTGAALARMDGHVWASDAESVRTLLGRLGWERHRVEVETLDPDAALVRAADRTPLPAARRAHFTFFAGLQSLRDLANAHVLWTMALLGGIAAFATWRLGHLFRAAWRRSTQEGNTQPAPESEWSSPSARPDVKVVLVASRSALEAVRTAIGEEHILASTPDAFAFAHGWILSVRQNTVWQLVSELGWGERRLRVWEAGGPIDNVSDEDRGSADPLTVIDALHLVGPIAHSEGAAI